MRDSIEAMRVVLCNGVEVDPTGSSPTAGVSYPTPLHHAVPRNIDDVKLLLDHGADVKKKGYFSHTPFHSAAKAGKTDVVRLLLERWPEGERS
jgi:ankyrin repeat protein